jgi:hypothetical protein
MSTCKGLGLAGTLWHWSERDRVQKVYFLHSRERNRENACEVLKNSATILAINNVRKHLCPYSFCTSYDTHDRICQGQFSLTKSRRPDRQFERRGMHQDFYWYVNQRWKLTPFQRAKLTPPSRRDTLSMMFQTSWRNKGMIQMERAVKIRRRHLVGKESIKSLSRELGISRNTVRRIVRNQGLVKSIREKSNPFLN